MQKVMNWFTKGRVMLIGLIGTGVFVGDVYYIDVFCRKGMHVCTNFHEITWMLSMVFVSVLLGSIVTYKMKEEVFVSWRNFSIAFVLLSFFVIAVLPFKCDPYVRICKESFSWGFAIIHFSLSSLIIIYKAIKLR